MILFKKKDKNTTTSPAFVHVLNYDNVFMLMDFFFIKISFTNFHMLKMLQ